MLDQESTGSAPKRDKYKSLSLSILAETALDCASAARASSAVSIKRNLKHSRCHDLEHWYVFFVGMFELWRHSSSGSDQESAEWGGIDKRARRDFVASTWSDTEMIRVYAHRLHKPRDPLVRPLEPGQAFIAGPPGRHGRSDGGALVVARTAVPREWTVYRRETACRCGAVCIATFQRLITTWYRGSQLRAHRGQL